MHKLIYIFRYKISSYLIIFFLKLNAHNLCALVLWLNIRKLRKLSIDSKKIIPKKILILPKSGGNEDLIETFTNKKNYHLNFFWFPRKFLKVIHKYYFKDNIIKDYFTKYKSPNLINKKKLYVNSLIKIFQALNNFLKFDAIISFNIFYYAEKHLDEVTAKLNKKFIVIHKESTFTPAEEIACVNIYKKFNDKSSATKISVYSESQKKILIKSKIANKKQIVVNGCPRSDYSFNLRKIEPKHNNILYYIIEKSRSRNLISKKFNINWNNLYDDTLDYLIEYAKKNPNIRLILKGKTGIHNKLLNKKFLTKNCIFINGGTGEKYLKDAKVVIAFNSTSVFETILSNRNLIIPNFNHENFKNKKLTYKIEELNYFANSKSEFFQKINLYLKSNYKNRILTSKEKKILKYYLGNYDGKSGKRLEKFLRKAI